MPLKIQNNLKSRYSSIDHLIIVYIITALQEDRKMMLAYHLEK
jgi:hypothetical protein